MRENMGKWAPGRTMVSVPLVVRLLLQEMVPPMQLAHVGTTSVSGGGHLSTIEISPGHAHHWNRDPACRQTSRSHSIRPEVNLWIYGSYVR